MKIRARRCGRPSSARGFRHLRQEHREQPDRRQEGADLIDESDTGMVRHLAEHGGAKAADDNNDAAPAATRNVTQRIGFVLLSGEADNGGLTAKNSRPDDAIKCLSGA